MNNFFNLLDNFSCLNDRSVSNNLDFFDSVLNNYLFSHDWYFIWLSNNSVCLDNLLYDLWNLDNFLYSLDDWNWLLDNSINNLMFCFNVILNYLYNLWVFYWDSNLNDSLYFNNLRYLNNLLDNLLDDNWNLDYFFNNLGLLINKDFLNNWYFSYLYLNIVLNFFNFDYLFYLNNFFYNLLYCNNLWHLFDDFNYSFNNLRNLNYSLDNFLNWNNLFNNICYNNWHLEWNVNNFFNLFDLFNFNDLLSDFVNSNNTWYFDNTINNLLYDFLNFNKFWYNSEDL